MNKEKLIKRIKESNFKKISYFLKNERPSLYNKDDCIYYSGIFNFPRKSIFLTHLIIQEMIDLEDVQNNLEMLDSSRGRKMQKEYFKLNIYLPVKNWMKNRKIKNVDMFVALVNLKINNDELFTKIAKQLDKMKREDNINYSVQSLLMAKYKALQ